MSELFTEREDNLSEEQEAHGVEDTFPAENVLPTVESGEAPKIPKLKFTKKKLAICGAVLVAVIAVAFVFLHQSEFERVKNEVVQIAGRVSGGKDYFELDTYPDEYEDMDEYLVARLLPTQQENTLDGIRYANEALGFNGSLYSKMLKTTALMGRQSEETDKYRVSWTYHPDDGLEVTYEKK